MTRRLIKNREGVSKRHQSSAPGIAKLREAVSGSLLEKSAKENADGSRRKEPAAEIHPLGRKCVCCGAAISIYNADKFCSPCDKSIAEWKNFPWNRAEIEGRMSKYCLVYVRENLAKKRSRGGGGGETSSGSFMRAVGRKAIQRKGG